MPRVSSARAAPEMAQGAPQQFGLAAGSGVVIHVVGVGKRGAARKVGGATAGLLGQLFRADQERDFRQRPRNIGKANRRYPVGPSGSTCQRRWPARPENRQNGRPPAPDRQRQTGRARKWGAAECRWSDGTSGFLPLGMSGYELHRSRKSRMAWMGMRAQSGRCPISCADFHAGLFPARRHRSRARGVPGNWGRKSAIPGSVQDTP